MLEFLGTDVAVFAVGRHLGGFGHCAPPLDLALQVGHDLDVVIGEIDQIKRVVGVVEEFELGAIVSDDDVPDELKAKRGQYVTNELIRFPGL